MSEKAIEILRDLISIPSVNPMRETTEPIERGVVDYLENIFRRAAIDCERQEISPTRENIIAIVRPNKKQVSKQQGLMFCSHMDTVPVENMTIEPFNPVVRNGQMYGRGACDAKGSIAAMVASLLNYSERRDRPQTIILAATADEEYTFQGVWKLIEKDWLVDSCIVGEPTGLKSIVAHKGVLRWRVQVMGRSAHGAMPHLGKSAIYDGARTALAFENYAANLMLQEKHELLGTPTLNVGRVWGGQSVNIVPDFCEFEIERRLLPNEDANKVLKDCEDYIRRQIGDETELVFENPYLIDPALETPVDAPLVELITRAHQAVTGTPNVIEGAYYGTDGSKLARAGMNVVVCGPGNISNAHTAAEFIEIEQLNLAVSLYNRVITEWEIYF